MLEHHKIKEHSRPTHSHSANCTINLLGVRVHGYTLPQVLTWITRHIQAEEHITLAYANVHAINLAHSLPWFRDFLNQSDLVFCDGFGVKWGVRLLGHTIPQRFTPPDWLDQLAATAEQHDFRLFFLGARPGVAEQAATRLQQRFPRLQVVGTAHGYFDTTPGSAENEAVIQAINASRPHILIVGLGMPLQEHWIYHNRSRLQANVVLPVGAALDYVAGAVPRGPAWMTNHGMEWLARLLIEPRRLWRRYLLGNPLFLWRVLRQRSEQLSKGMAAPAHGTSGDTTPQNESSGKKCSR
jgi:N-acetylglucosaminyldiphosphoundecaprenol N-acetyl-beta-D-mannosaminyltransferase